jgi:hypothetical protein
MCMSAPKPPPPKPTIAPPPPPEAAPSELGDAVDSNAAMRKKKRSGAKASLGRGKTGTQVYGGASGSGLKIK